MPAVIEGEPMVVITIREGGVREVYCDDQSPVVVLDYDIDGDERHAKIVGGEPCLVHRFAGFTLEDDFANEIERV